MRRDRISLEIMGKLNEDFWNPGKYFRLLKDMEDIDTEKWNNAKSQKERDDMVRPFLQEFWDKYKEEMTEPDIFDLFDDMEDSNYHTEYRILRDIIWGKKESVKVTNKKSLKEAADLDIVFTCCYNTLDVWKSRQEAMDFYEECQYSSEGSERERYTNIYFDLKSGAELAIDFEDEADVREIAWMGSKAGSSFPVALVKQNLDGWESAETVAKKIKGGKILPPKEFLDSLK